LLIITRSPIFQIFVSSKIHETFSIIAESVKELSEKHIGALIVLPRSQNIEMTIDKGISINAEVSKDLLLSIFNPKSPLHDGAIIVENKTIVSSGNTLPLTKKDKLGKKNLGMRHKAALGLSEITDVVVIIVSEETGALSIADSGSLFLNLDKSSFETDLKVIFNNQNVEEYVLENNITKV